MPSSSKQSSSFDSTTKTDPWGPAIPQLGNLLNFTQSTFPTLGINGNQQFAFDRLQQNAAAGNPYANDIGGVAHNLLAGGGPDRSGYTTQGLGQLQSSLTPIANQSTNPYDNQAYKQLADTITSDTKDQVKSAYAGAGYSPATVGDFSQQLGRGIAQGVAPTFMQAQDQLTGQVQNAANSLYQGGASTSGILNGLDQTRLGNQITGIGASGAALQAQDAPWNQMLNVQNQQQQLPLQQIASLEGAVLPIAGMGGTSNTAGSMNTSGSSFNPMGILSGVGGLFSGGTSSAMSGLMGMGGLFGLSDIRAKDDIAKVGELNDGTGVYSYRYKGQPQTQLGLLAQEVEQRNPDAVREFGGLKHVDYHKATERARGVA